MPQTKTLTALFCSAVFLAAIACGSSTGVIATSRPEYGPPPHAPAHGQRAKSTAAHDVKLVFDSGLGVYVAVDVPNTYYFEGVYFRLVNGHWKVAAAIGGPWDPPQKDSVPPGLRKKYSKKHKKKKDHPAKGHGAAKGAW
jgi:hypothetical protein